MSELFEHHGDYCDLHLDITILNISWSQTESLCKILTELKTNFDDFGKSESFDQI